MEITENLPPTPEIKRWGATGDKKWTGPTWARFRLFIQYHNGNAKYHSFDYSYRYVNGIKTKFKSERIGFTKLLELMNKKTKGNTYRYACIFANLTSNTNTLKGDYNYVVCTIVAGNIKWKDPMYWKPSPEEETLDIAKMKEYTLKLKCKEDPEIVRLRVQKQMEEIISPAPQPLNNQ